MSNITSITDNEFVRYVITLSKTDKKITEELIKAHVEHLKTIDKDGKLVLCGPFSDNKGGMAIINVKSFEEAKEIAESDPFVKSGVETYEIRVLELSCKENNHMGFG